MTRARSTFGRWPIPLLLVAALAAGCATTRRGYPQELRWPFAPEKARIKFVREFKSEADLETSWGRRLARVFIPASPDAVIAQPTGLALSTDEKTLFVACASAGKVLAVDLVGGKISLAANVEGNRPLVPTDVAVDGNDNLYVSDSKGNAVWVFGPKGEFVRRIAHEKIDFPTMIAVDRTRQVLYVVTNVLQKSPAHRVEVFSLKGEPIRTIGKRGPNAGEFNFPTHATVGPDGRLYVVDMLNFRVQVFDPEGNPAGAFGAIGANEIGFFEKAKGIALDSFGNIYVTDSQTGWVQMFNPRFQPLMAFAARSPLPGYFSLPTDIAISSDNRIYVADFGDGRVNEYKLVNTTAEDSFLSPGSPSAAPNSTTPTPTP
jgi:DNA-binding beta-propeller fold protein YncE